MSAHRQVLTLLAVSISCLFVASQPSSVVAANNQGLEWGIEVDGRFDYSVKVTYHNATLDLDIDDGMYVIINDLPVIPDNVTHLVHIAFYEYTTYWDNGTVMGSFWTDVLHLSPFYVLPVGNWSLMEALWLTTGPPGEAIQDESYFTTLGTPSGTYNSTIVFSKSDGVLAHLIIDWIRTGMGDSLSVELTRAGYVPPTTTTTTTSTTPASSTTTSITTSTAPGGDGTFLLLLGGAGAVVVVIAIVLAARRK